MSKKGAACVPPPPRARTRVQVRGEPTSAAARLDNVACIGKEMRGTHDVAFERVDDAVDDGAAAKVEGDVCSAVVPHNGLVAQSGKGVTVAVLSGGGGG